MSTMADQIAEVIRRNTTRSGYAIDKHGLSCELADLLHNQGLPNFSWDHFVDLCYAAPEGDMDHLAAIMSSGFDEAVPGGEPSAEDLSWHEGQLMQQQIEEGRLTDNPGSIPPKAFGPFGPTPTYFEDNPDGLPS